MCHCCKKGGLSVVIANQLIYIFHNTSQWSPGWQWMIVYCYHYYCSNWYIWWSDHYPSQNVLHLHSSSFTAILSPPCPVWEGHGGMVLNRMSRRKMAKLCWPRKMSIKSACALSCDDFVKKIVLRVLLWSWTMAVGWWNRKPRVAWSESVLYVVKLQCGYSVVRAQYQ